MDKEKTNLIKKVLASLVMVMALVLFFGTSKSKLPAPEGLVANVLSSDSQSQKIQIKFKPVVDNDGQLVDTYKIKIKSGRKSLSFKVNTQTKTLTNLKKNNKLVKYNFIKGFSINKIGDQYVLLAQISSLNFDIPPAAPWPTVTITSIHGGDQKGSGNKATVTFDPINDPGSPSGKTTD